MQYVILYDDVLNISEKITTQEIYECEDTSQLAFLIQCRLARFCERCELKRAKREFADKLRDYRDD